MKKFKQVDIKVEFTLSTTSEVQIDEIMELLEKKQWGWLLAMASENNMAVNRPMIRAQTNSADSE